MHDTTDTTFDYHWEVYWGVGIGVFLSFPVNGFVGGRLCFSCLTSFYVVIRKLRVWYISLNFETLFKINFYGCWCWTHFFRENTNASEFANVMPLLIKPLTCSCKGFVSKALFIRLCENPLDIKFSQRETYLYSYAAVNRKFVRLNMSTCIKYVLVQSTNTKSVSKIIETSHIKVAYDHAKL